MLSTVREASVAEKDDRGYPFSGVKSSPSLVGPQLKFTLSIVLVIQASMMSILS